LALKGGTALNLFLFNVPRLSIDIDLNYVGAETLDAMLAERPRVEQALQAVFSRERFNVRQMPEEHAGGKWSLRYESADGRTGNVEVDINFMFRVPLWPITSSDSQTVGAWQAKGIPLLDCHELAAGKLAALLSRGQPRDLFDSQQILQMKNLDPQKLRIAFVVYGAMNRKDWRTVSPTDVDFEASQLSRQLIPTLRTGSSEIHTAPIQYGKHLVRECREGLSTVLPFTEPEMEFLDLILDRGLIDPTFLAPDKSLQERIKSQPMLVWKALNVRRHKGLD
jgi:predicted nucleotidyltransferase component of viral defense system